MTTHIGWLAPEAIPERCPGAYRHRSSAHRLHGFMVTILAVSQVLLGGGVMGPTPRVGVQPEVEPIDHVRWFCGTQIAAHQPSCNQPFAINGWSNRHFN
jgi:hypothetical protein